MTAAITSLGFFSRALQDHERRTPLHAAACVGDVHIMDLLIESGE